jgi:hypothetical protein
MSPFMAVLKPSNGQPTIATIVPPTSDAYRPEDWVVVMVVVVVVVVEEEEEEEEEGGGGSECQSSVAMISQPEERMRKGAGSNSMIAPMVNKHCPQCEQMSQKFQSIKITCNARDI